MIELTYPFFFIYIYNQKERIKIGDKRKKYQKVKEINRSAGGGVETKKNNNNNNKKKERK